MLSPNYATLGPRRPYSSKLGFTKHSVYENEMA
jgi:hypothetical protein